MRKLFVGIMMITVALLSACLGTKQQGEMEFKNPIEISLWHYYLGNNKTQLETAIEEFNNTVGLEKGIIVTPYGKGSVADLEAAVTKASLGLIDSEKMPDIFSIYPDKALEFGKNHLLCDFRKYLTQEELNRYVGSFLQDGIVLDNDEIMILPVAKSTEFLYVNATDFDKFCKDTGFSYDSLSTWEGILNTARAYYQYTDAMTKEPNDGKAFMGLDAVANYIVVSTVQLGADVVNSKKERADLDLTQLRRIFDNYYTGHVLGYYGREGKFRADDVRTGKLIAYAGSSSSAGYFPTWLERNGKTEDIEMKILPYPTFEGGEPCAIRQGAGMCVAVSDYEHEKAAVEFLKWFTDTDVNIYFTQETGYIPVTDEAYSDAKKEYIKSLSDGSNPVKKNTMTAYQEAMKQILHSRTYSAKPFIGSYDIRMVMEKALLNFTDDGVKTADELRASGKTEEEILKALDTDQQFELWLQQIRSQFRHNDVAYADR